MCKFKNNPLNIRYSGFNRWQGLCGERKGFCEFSTLSYGIRAAAIILMRSYRKYDCDTVRSIIRRWAPPSENPTDEYIKFVCEKTKMIAVETLRKPAQYALLIWAMAWFEQGHKPEFTPLEVMQCFTKFKISIQ